jgi:pimeloyl-ACP methyl ester carboxylesterase
MSDASPAAITLPAIARSVITANDIRVEAVEMGRGRPLLFLHPEIGIDPAAPVLERLAAHARVIAPSHPGFGGSAQPRAFTTIDDLAYFYLDLLDALDLRDTVVVGSSLGAWIAAEIAIKSTARISHLVLANPVGIKISDRETRDIVDIFATADNELHDLLYFDPTVAVRDYKAMPEDDVRRVARNREATARYAWSPFMHDPKLKGRLHRIRIPTLCLWGSADRMSAQSYGRAYCAAIPGARFETIERAGHFPHIEQPDEFARRVFAFVEGTAP